MKILSIKKIENIAFDLKSQIAANEKFHLNPNLLEEGILITANEAKLLVEVIEQYLQTETL